MEERHSIDQDLPLHWYRYFDDDGGEYFYNDETGETTWDHPGAPEPTVEVPATNPNWQPPEDSASSNPFGDENESVEVFQPPPVAVVEEERPPEPLTSHPTEPPSDLSSPPQEPQPAAADAASLEEPQDHETTDQHKEPTAAVDENAPSAAATSASSEADRASSPTAAPSNADCALDNHEQPPSPSEGEEALQPPASEPQVGEEAVAPEDQRPVSVADAPSPAPVTTDDVDDAVSRPTVSDAPPSPPAPAAVSANPFGDDGPPSVSPPAPRPASIVVSTATLARGGVPIARPLSTSNPFADEPSSSHSGSPTDEDAVISVTTPDDARRYLGDAVPTVASPTAAASPPSASAHNMRVPVEQRRVAPVVAVPAEANEPSQLRSGVGAREVRLEKRHSATATATATATVSATTAAAANPFGTDDSDGANSFAAGPAANSTAAVSRGGAGRPASVAVHRSASSSAQGSSAQGSSAQGSSTVGSSSGGGFHHVNMVAALSNPYVDSDSDRVLGDSRARPSLPPQHVHSRTNDVDHRAAAARPVSMPLAPRPSPLAAAFDASAAPSGRGAAYVNSRYHPAASAAASAAAAAPTASGVRTPLPPPPLRPAAGHTPSQPLPPPPTTNPQTAARRSVAVAALGQSSAAMSVDNAANNAYHLAHPTHPTTAAPAPTGQRPAPPPVPPRRRPLPLTPSNSASLSTSAPSSSAAAAQRPTRSTFPFAAQLQQLVTWGVKPAFAEACLLDAQGNVDAALALVHEALVAALAHTDLTSGSVGHQWYPRVTVSIRSWLPNFIETGDKDYHTVYVIHVTLHFDDSATTHGRFETWQLLYRYQRFRSLYYALQPLIGRVLGRRHHEAIAAGIYDVPDFPLAGLGDWMFGISDEQRNGRMSSLHAWCEAIVVHPLLMTHAEIRRLVWEFFDVDKHV